MSLTELRGDVVILACAVSAGIHGALAPDHFDESTEAGFGFVAATLLLAALVVWLTRRPSSPSALAAAAAAFGGLLVSYALAATTGLPGLHPEPEPVDGLALATKAIEAVGLLAASTSARARRPIPISLAALVALFSALAALAVSGGHDPHAHAGAAHHATSHAAASPGD